MRCWNTRHYWEDHEDAKRCCNPDYVRVQALRREDLEAIGAEHIVFRQMWRGWRKVK